eukprot:19293-Heterococcus_DN1.PRE.3
MCSALDTLLAAAATWQHSVQLTTALLLVLHAKHCITVTKTTTRTHITTTISTTAIYSSFDVKRSV